MNFTLQSDSAWLKDRLARENAPEAARWCRVADALESGDIAQAMQVFGHIAGPGQPSLQGRLMLKKRAGLIAKLADYHIAQEKVSRRAAAQWVAAQIKIFRNGPDWKSLKSQDHIDTPNPVRRQLFCILKTIDAAPSWQSVYRMLTSINDS